MNYKKIIYESHSWSDLDRKLSKLTHSNKTFEAGAIFAQVVKIFLQTNPVYKTKILNVWLENETPNNIRKKINLPSRDEGIDLIVETKEKRIWSVQAKYRSNPKEMLKFTGENSLSTFTSLSFFTCSNISHGLVCATIDKPPKKTHLLPKKKNKTIGFILSDTWQSLDNNNKEEWNIIRKKIKGIIKKPEKKIKKEFQKTAVNKVIDYFANKDKGKLIMPCGTGKSLMSFWIAKELNVKKIIVAVPSLSLVSQTLKVWTTEFIINGIYPEWICVCSDQTVSKNQDEFISFAHDLGIETTTDKKVIQDFLKNNTKNIKVVFTTYQSGKVLAKASNGIKYDLAIFDEAHKTVGNEDKLMSYLLKDNSIKVEKKLFMTATERMYHTKKNNAFSMDNINIYGDEIHSLSFKEAIEDKDNILSDYKVMTLTVQKNDIEKLINTNEFIELKKINKNVSAREFASSLVLRKKITELNLKKTITFHSNLDKAEKYSSQQEFINKRYKKFKKMKIYHIRGDMPVSERNIQLKGFEENDSIITNARCLTEGIDVPAVDCISFIDPKQSIVDIVQAAGRAMRKSKNKKYGYIYIPIVIPKNESLNDIKDDVSFKKIVTVISALASNDNRIVDHLRSIASDKNKYIHKSPIDELVNKKEFRKIDPKKFEKAIKLNIWERIKFRVMPDLKKEDLDKWILDFKNYYGKYPDKESGLVKDTLGETWEKINGAMAKGTRNFGEKITLNHYIMKKFRNNEYTQESKYISEERIDKDYKLTAIKKYIEKKLIHPKKKILDGGSKLVDGFLKTDLLDVFKKLGITLFFKGSPHVRLKEIGVEFVSRKNYLSQFEADKLIGISRKRYVKYKRISIAGKAFTKGGISIFYLKDDVYKIKKLEDEWKKDKYIGIKNLRKDYKIFLKTRNKKYYLGKGKNTKQIDPAIYYFRGKEVRPLFIKSELIKYRS